MKKLTKVFERHTWTVYRSLKSYYVTDIQGKIVFSSISKKAVDLYIMTAFATEIEAKNQFIIDLVKNLNDLN